MTPREPDRFDKQAREIWGGDFTVAGFAAALRAEHEATLERAAQFVDDEDEGRTGRGFELGDVSDFRKRCVAGIRALKEPAAAPAAAQTDAPSGPVCGCGKPSRYESGWCGETNCFNPAPAAEAKVNACQVDLRTDKDRECFDDIVQAATRALRSERATAEGTEALLRECEEWMRGRLRHMGTGTVERISCETILAKLAARTAQTGGDR